MDSDVEAEAERFIMEFYKGESTGHDYWHSLRVRNTAMLICDTEKGADRNIVAVTCLLHDLDDRKLGGDWKNLSVAKKFLEEHGATDGEMLRITDIINHISFKGKDTKVPESLEGMIVQDADRLDAIGAIGIARAFAYGGKHGRAIFDPTAKRRTDMSEEEYFSGTSDSISHFHEKLVLLKDLMNTSEGRRLAEKRHAFTIGFLREFDDEWNGIC